MAQIVDTETVSDLVINKVPSQAIYDDMAAHGQINENELYLVEGDTEPKPSLVRPNLLDNWYFVGGGSQQGGGQFPINQRGQTTYNDSTSAFCIDRWYRRTSTTSGKVTDITLTSSGLSLSANYISDTTYSGFTQKLNNADDLLGKTVTISALIKNFDSTKYGLTFGLYSATGVLNSKSYGGVTINGNGLFSKTYELPTEPYAEGYTFNVSFFGASVTSFTIVAVKAEIGDTQTLAHQENGEWVLNEIPNFEEQLYRCNTSKAYSGDDYTNKVNAYGDIGYSGTPTYSVPAPVKVIFTLNRYSLPGIMYYLPDGSYRNLTVWTNNRLIYQEYHSSGTQVSAITWTGTS